MVSGPFQGPLEINISMKRSVCPQCRIHPVAINYYRNNKVHFRTLCTPCIHKRRRTAVNVPGWLRAGYKKRDRCERCNFKFKLTEQSTVYYVDGNTANNHWSNLRTICANCSFDVKDSHWRPSRILPDS
jgi:Zn ribbon nucleic-acid-binding protein